MTVDDGVEGTTSVCVVVCKQVDVYVFLADGFSIFRLK